MFKTVGHGSINNPTIALNEAVARTQHIINFNLKLFYIACQG